MFYIGLDTALSDKTIDKSVAIKQIDVSGNQSEDKINKIKDVALKSGMSDRRTSLPQLFADVEVSTVRLTSNISGKVGHINSHSDNVESTKKKEILVRKDEIEKDVEVPKILKKDIEGSLRCKKKNSKDLVKEKEEKGGRDGKGRETEVEAKEDCSLSVPALVSTSVETLDFCIPTTNDLGSEVRY